MPGVFVILSVNMMNTFGTLNTSHLSILSFGSIVIDSKKLGNLV